MQCCAKALKVFEGVPFKVDEAFVQRLWFEQAYQNPLQTVEGKKIEILQTGFWNHGAGPDFLQACLMNEKGEKEVGAVEIHLGAQDWHSHDHEYDPLYEKVILHVIWKMGAKDFFPKKIENKFIRQVELCHQLKLPLERLQSAFTTVSREREIGARMGECSKELSRWSDEKIKNFLEDAGWYRFYKKKALWDARVELLGFEQSLWMGLAESLGYAGNKDSFRLLAQRLQISDLLKIASSERREALLFGMAGFLPDKILPKHAPNLRKLWDYWWIDRSEWQEFILSKKNWKLSGVRPANRPERRLAVLALLSERKKWQDFLCLTKKGDPKNIEDWLEKLSHPFWDEHFTFSSSQSKKHATLMGKDRINSLLFNIIWPIFHRDENRLKEWFGKISFSDANRSARIASVRLFGEHKLPRTLLIQEGLIQIYEDFCLKDFSECKECYLLKCVAKNHVLSTDYLSC